MSAFNAALYWDITLTRDWLNRPARPQPTDQELADFFNACALEDTEPGDMTPQTEQKGEGNGESLYETGNAVTAERRGAAGAGRMELSGVAPRVA